MADKKISQLTAATTPLAGTEVLPVVQGGATDKVSVANLTAGRSVGMQQANITAAAGGGFGNPALIADDGTGAARIVFLNGTYAGVPAGKPWLHSYQDIYVGSDASTAFNVMSGGTKTLGVDASGNAAAAGNFVVGTAGKGIDFSANGGDVLSQYDEGTWTPGFAFGGGSTGVAYSVQTGYYTRVGNIVHATCICDLSAKGSSTGSVSMTGLPFAIANNNAAYTAGSVRFHDITYSGQLVTLGLPNTTTVVLEQVTEAGVRSGLTDANFVDYSGIVLTLTYRAA